MFNAKEAAEGCIQWIRDWFELNGKNCIAVIGISGGKDSAINAGLCVKALGAERVIGVMLPQDTQADIQDARDVIKFLGIRSIEYNIGPTVNKMLWEFEKSCPNMELTQQARENLPPRLRLSSLRLIAQCVNGRISNNCNASEDYIGYSTVDGDNRGDFSPSTDFTVTEMIAIGRYIGIPERFLLKAPADGLCGKTDEEKIGFSYAVLDKYIRTGEIDDVQIKARIDEMHKRNLFKVMPMAYYKYWDHGDISDSGVASDILSAGKI